MLKKSGLLAGTLNARSLLRRSNLRLASGWLKGTALGCRASSKGCIPSFMRVSCQCPAIFVGVLIDHEDEASRTLTKLTRRRVVMDTHEKIRINIKDLLKKLDKDALDGINFKYVAF